MGTAHAEHLDPQEHTLWTLINDYRQENGLRPVGLNPQLMAAAEWMSEDMAANDRYSHIDSKGRSPKQRMTDFGYIGQMATGENLAASYDTAQAALDAWKDSPKHNANMLSPYFCAVGIARVYDEDSLYGWYWTVDFGGRGPAWFPPTPIPTPVSVLPADPYESPHGDEAPPLTPTPTPAPTPAPVPAELPSTGQE